MIIWMDRTWTGYIQGESKIKKNIITKATFFTNEIINDQPSVLLCNWHNRFLDYEFLKENIFDYLAKGPYLKVRILEMCFNNIYFPFKTDNVTFH